MCNLIVIIFICNISGIISNTLRATYISYSVKYITRNILVIRTVKYITCNLLVILFISNYLLVVMLNTLRAES